MSTRFNRAWLAAGVLLAAACTDQQPLASGAASIDAPAAEQAIQAFDCVASVRSGTVSCGVAAGSGASRAIYGSNNNFVKVTSSNVSSSGGIFQFDVTVQNLLNEQIGTPDGVIVDTAAVSVFFASQPTVTSGTGSVTVANADGQKVFTGAEPQAFFRYNQKLAKDQVSSAKTWQLAYDAGVQSFSFRLYVAAELQPLVVINELLVNPANFNANPDVTGEWFELYNAGSFPVQMQNMVIADSAASGRRPYHVIASSVVVQPGAYVTFGNNSNTANNGGVPIDYNYGASLSFANSLDALKIARVYGTDTLTLDRTQYASAAVSAQDGISRELLNPALDNSNMDGSNWGSASVTAVYGPGGRGTPKAQNSTYTP